MHFDIVHQQWFRSRMSKRKSNLESADLFKGAAKNRTHFIAKLVKITFTLIVVNILELPFSDLKENTFLAIAIANEYQKKGTCYKLRVKFALRFNKMLLFGIYIETFKRV